MQHPMRRWVFTVLGAVPFCLLLSPAEGSPQAKEERAWTVQDSIGVRYFVSHTPGSASFLGDADYVVASPDARHFLFVTRHGDLTTDQNVYTLNVYGVDALKSVLSSASRRETWLPKPQLTVSLSDGRSEMWSGAITAPQWDGNTAVVFRGAEGEGPHRIYRLDLTTKSLQRFDTGDVDFFSMESPAFRGGSFVVAARGERKAWAPLNKYPMVSIVGNELTQIYRDSYYDGHEIFASYHAGSAKSIAKTPYFARASVSPDGRWAVAVFAPAGHPVAERWKQYERVPATPYPGPAQFMLLDLQAGEYRPLIDAPVAGLLTAMGEGIPATAMWSDDSQSVILINAALPLTDDAPERSRTAYIAEYDLRSGRVSVLETLRHSNGSRFKEAGWLRDGRELLITRQTVDGAPAPGTIYRWERSGWKSRSVPSSMQIPPSTLAKLPNGFTVQVQESANEPPVMVASDGRHTLPLTDPDPALEGIWRAQMREVSWTEPSGRTLKGGLLLPRNFTPGRPVPIVIQPYTYRPDRFRPDGFFHNSHATQALVSRGMAVLLFSIEYLPADLPDPSLATTGTPREGPAFVERVDAAVESLHRAGLVDRNRVALSGWSRSGFLTYYALTHAGRVPLAAAVVSDAFTGSYFEYLETFALDVGTRQAYEPLYGGSFWKEPTTWIRESATFNPQHVRAPVLFSFPAGGKLAAIEIIGGLRAHKKPFEFLYFPESAHEPRRPREREAMMQASVDWLAFWLLNEQPTDSDRRLRWQNLKSGSLVDPP